MSSNLLTRLSILLALLLAVVVVSQSFGPGVESYFWMQVQTTDGRPYLMLQSSAASGVTFNMYAPASTENAESWEPVVSNRIGPVYGFYGIPAAAAKPDGAPATNAKLGVFDENR